MYVMQGQRVEDAVRGLPPPGSTEGPDLGHDTAVGVQGACAEQGEAWDGADPMTGQQGHDKKEPGLRAVTTLQKVTPSTTVRLAAQAAGQTCYKNPQSRVILQSRRYLWRVRVIAGTWGISRCWHAEPR